MNANELIVHTSQATGVSQAETKRIIDAYLAGIVQSLKEGKDATLHSIGKLTVKDTPERIGRNPATGENITIPAGRRTKFTPAKSLKDSLK